MVSGQFGQALDNELAFECEKFDGSPLDPGMIFRVVSRDALGIDGFGSKFGACWMSIAGLVADVLQAFCLQVSACRLTPALLCGSTILHCWEGRFGHSS